MRRALSFVAAIVLVIALSPIADAKAAPHFSAGSRGAGDPYFPLDGNGGYQVDHYGLNVTYHPDSDRLAGVATIEAIATKNLSRFNFDFDGLTVRSIRVDGSRATWERRRGELMITPQNGIVRDGPFVVVVRYKGIPKTFRDALGISGPIRTQDGVLLLGEPHGATTWFPANDHPIDKAAFSFDITVPEGLEAISNGVLEGSSTHGGWTTWSWRADDPMAPYLAAMAIGEFDIRAYETGGIRFWDAVDPVLLEPVATPRTGDRFAISRSANFGYKRLSHTIDVPAEGGQLSFYVQRDTEPGYDFFFVEAHTVGQDDWTTLRDERGHTTRELPCPFLIEEHPFLEHYVTASPNGSCDPTGTTGRWRAASGFSDGWERWIVDLSRWAGESVEVALAVASDFSVPVHGVFVDDVVVSTGSGTTSFEDDGNEFDGWTVTGAPEGSPGNANDWIVGTGGETPNYGVVASDSMERQPEILGFESDVFGPYPFEVSGGVVDDAELFYALEVQTRPIYSKYFFDDPVQSDSVFVHELAHQWFGDSVAVKAWRHIWLNEGFATYAEWLWSEHEGLGTTQELFDGFYAEIPRRDPFWGLKIGNPGPRRLFDGAVYVRGAMTLQQLSVTIGDDAFFELLQQWYATHAGGHGTTGAFVALAEEISGQELSDFFHVWLFTESKPDLAVSARLAGGAVRLPVSIEKLQQRLKGAYGAAAT
jgi:Peptidase family M1 domain/Peptidase M1 N-terminal domain